MVVEAMAADMEAVVVDLEVAVVDLVVVVAVALVVLDSLEDSVGPQEVAAAMAVIDLMDTEDTDPMDLVVSDSAFCLYPCQSPIPADDPTHMDTITITTITTDTTAN